MPSMGQPLTLAQIRQQTADLLGGLMAEQSFTPDQQNEAVNWACEELARTLGMSYVPMTPCFFQAGNLRRPGVPDACIRVVSALLVPETGTTKQVPNGGLTTPVAAAIDTTLYGDVCEVMTTDGATKIFMARHNGAFFSGNPKGWVIVQSDATGATAQLVAGIIGPNDPYASPPTSDTAYTAPVDGVAGVSTVMDVLSLAVSPDGTSVAWFEGTTNRLRVAKLSAGVWTTRTVAGAYNTYRVDGTGAAAGFSAGLADAGDINFGAYGYRFFVATGFGITFLDNNTLLMTETPISAGSILSPSRLLEIDITTGVVHSLATENVPSVPYLNRPVGFQGTLGGWMKPVLLPVGQAINGCRLLFNRTFLGLRMDTSNLESLPNPISDAWPSYIALDGMQGAIANTSPVVEVAITGQVPSGPGAVPFEEFLGTLALDVSPLGLLVCVPAQVNAQNVTNADGTPAYYPAQADYGTIPFKALAVGLGVASFPDHMVSFSNGDFSATPPIPAYYLQGNSGSGWLGAQLIVNVAGNLLSFGGA